MEDRSAARRPNLELVKKQEAQTDVTLKTKDQRHAGGPAGSARAEGSPGVITSGAILEGKYLVGRIIGSGAVGIVFEAKNVELDETVAIKCLRPEMLVDTGMVARFAREAKAAAAIKSEYVATVHDVGTTEDGIPYMVMEYLEGKDLGVVVTETGSIAPRTAVEYALQVCEALACAHSKGIVHRDIKPENLLLTERAGGMRIVKVLDFGISKTALTGSIFQNELPLVKTVNLMGTPLYMSPEQVRISDSVDVRSDIWSLGMVIYEILTGHTAFNGASITEICAAILEAAPNPIELHRNDLPSGLVEVITRCLQKDVNKRYQNIAELAMALMPFGPKRSRLNVERAVAVLQSSGAVDPDLRFDSTIPPASSEFALTPIPKAPSLPGAASQGLLRVLSSSPNLGASVLGSAPAPPSSTASAYSSFGPVEDEVYPAPKKKPVALVAAGTALLLALGTIALVAGRTKPVAVAPPSPTVTAATTTPPASRPPPPAPPEPATVPAAATTATATVTPAAIPAPPTRPAWATAPRTSSHAAPKPVAVQPLAPAAPPAVKPKPTGTEPDLGY